MPPIKQLIPYFVLILCVLAALPVLHNYWAWDIQLIMCILICPFAFHLRYPHQTSFRYLVPFLLLLAIFGISQMKIFYLFGLGCAIFLIVESYFGKLGEMPLVFLALLSPVLQYFAKIFTFPIRLWLSKICGKIFSFFHFPIHVEGNVFEVDNISFAVDTACMGLNMLNSSLAICALLIAFGEKKTKKRLPLGAIWSVFILSFIFIILANLFRIIILVIFRAMPDTFGHEIIGLLCWTIYVILPLYFLIPLAYKKWGIFIKNSSTSAAPKRLFFFAKLIIYISPLLMLGFSLSYSPKNQQDNKTQNLNLVGFKKSVVENQVVKFENDSLLIYVKPAVAFYGTDHNPTICWQASGYIFSKINTQNIDNQAVFIAELHKGTEILYTAWWYDNGKDKTIAQLKWRWEMLKGQEPYRLINVSAKNQDKLKNACSILLKNHWF